ncbi:MAG: methyltransferase domain-containing protein [Pseudomonadota bacterium]
MSVFDPVSTPGTAGSRSNRDGAAGSLGNRGGAAGRLADPGGVVHSLVAEGHAAQTLPTVGSTARQAGAWASATERWLAPATDTVMDLAAVEAGQRVLIVEGGAGRAAIQAARRVGPAGGVLTTDRSAALASQAARNAADAGLPGIEALMAVAESLALEPASFDAALSCIALAHSAAPAAMLAGQVAALRPGGYLGALVYATAPECPAVSAPYTAIRARAAAEAMETLRPDPFALGLPGRIEALFSMAGLVGVQSVRIPAPLVFATAVECLQFQQDNSAALQEMLAGLAAPARHAAFTDAAEALAEFETDGRFVAPCTLIAAVGRKC